ncbi:unnamed protein product [Acanthosepion pharaonis]|uniref:Centromere protein M n=1 Tax=Acanthosepion pharaonis TaxID=158019 RepID=A0A812DN60_ACAPH|nr:unnamed protein product [Sepia pharaonis]
MAAVPSMTHMLRFNGCESLNKVSLLIFGVNSINKKKLSQTITKLSTNFDVKIQISDYLFPEKDKNPFQFNVDYICFVADISQKESLKRVTDSMKFIDAKYFLSRACLVVHIPNGCRENFSIELESINHLAKNYNLMTIFGNLEKGADKVSTQLLRLVEIACGFKKNGKNSLLLSLV